MTGSLAAAFARANLRGAFTCSAHARKVLQN